MEPPADEIPASLYHFTTRQVVDDLLDPSSNGHMVASESGRIGDGIYATSMEPRDESTPGYVEEAVFAGQGHDPPLDSVIVFATEHSRLGWNVAVDNPVEFVANVDPRDPVYVFDDIETVLILDGSSWVEHPNWG